MFVLTNYFLLTLFSQTSRAPQTTLRAIPAPMEYSAQCVKFSLAMGKTSMDAMSQKNPVNASIIGYMGDIGS